MRIALCIASNDRTGGEQTRGSRERELVDRNVEECRRKSRGLESRYDPNYGGDTNRRSSREQETAKSTGLHSDLLRAVRCLDAHRDDRFAPVNAHHGLVPQNDREVDRERFHVTSTLGRDVDAKRVG